MIIVTGMHRSGTSLVSQLMHVMGIPFGAADGFFAPDRWNEPGYYEQRDVMDANSLMITGLPRNKSTVVTALSQAVYATMPSAASVVRRGEAMLSHISTIAAKYRDCAVKDPRFCLTLPVWSRTGFVDRVVICLRHPADTVDSLARRNRFPRRLGYRFWHYHMNALLCVLDEQKTVFVQIERLSGPGMESELRSLGLALGVVKEGSDFRQAFQEVFKGGLLQSGAACGPLPDDVAATWERLLALAAKRRLAILEAAKAGGNV